MAPQTAPVCQVLVNSTAWSPWAMTVRGCAPSDTSGPHSWGIVHRRRGDRSRPLPSARQTAIHLGFNLNPDGLETGSAPGVETGFHVRPAVAIEYDWLGIVATVRGQMVDPPSLALSPVPLRATSRGTLELSLKGCA